MSATTLVLACGSSKDRPGDGGGSGSGSGSGGDGSGSGGTVLCTGDECQGPEVPAPPGCGNGVLTEDEVCDDHNTEGGDGCAANCLGVERGWSCPTPGEACIRIAVCGDGTVSFPEQCDDGNTEPDDGCSARCKVELGSKCEGEPSVCTPTVCGDELTEGAEGCDDGNTVPFDGCSPSCQWEPDCPSVGACTPRCGDGVVMPPEACDDGNLIDGDGCSSSCEEEEGYDCGPLNDLGDTMVVPIVYRDFKSRHVGGHDDFHTNGSCQGDWLLPYLGLVNPTLDVDRKPTFAHDELTCFITSQATFSTWFRDSAQAKTIPDFLTLTRDGDKFGFDAPLFVPLDGRGWVTDATNPEPTYVATDAAPYGDQMAHNFLFSSEVRYWFQYDPEADAEFFFRGDDDVWVFVGGTLVIDLGGAHGPATDSFVLNADTESAAGEPLGLEEGNVYEIAVFHAERNPVVSSYRLELSGFNPSPSECVPQCGDGEIGLGEECDDGEENNTGGYGRCGPDCRLTQFCGDGVVQTGEDCDDGAQNGQPGACPSGCRVVVVR